MSLEAIDMVMRAEQDGVSRRAAAEQDARNLTLNAERDGQAMLSRLREEMETQRKELLRQAETRAAQQAEKIHAEAIIVSDYSYEYSHWNAVESLGDWLKREKVPGITGIDTRELTKVLREHGVMMGKIVFENEELRMKNEELGYFMVHLIIFGSFD